MWDLFTIGLRSPWESVRTSPIIIKIPGQVTLVGRGGSRTALSTTENGHYGERTNSKFKCQQDPTLCDYSVALNR